MLARWLLLIPLLLGWAISAEAQLTDKTQTSAPFGLNAASASGGACVYPPSAVASCVKLDYQGYQGVAALLKGTWAGTVVGELSADGGTTWTSVNLVSSAGVSASTVTAAGLYNPSTVSGAQIFQIRVSVYTSGSVDVVLRGTLAQARGTPTGGGAPIGGSGTLNNLAKFTPNGSTVGNSLLTDDGTNVSLPSGAFRLFGSSTLFSEEKTNSAGSFLLNQATVKPAAPTAALAGAGAGNVDNGTHVYCVTFITATGETDCSTVSSAVTVVDKTLDGKVTVTFTASGFAGVTGRNVYRSKAGTTTPLFLVSTAPVVADNSTLTYSDNLADASLTATAAPTANTTDDARLTILNTGAFNAPTASVLTPGRTINGVAFDGSANITVTVPIATGVSGLGTGIATWLATPNSANLATAVTDELGSGNLLFGDQAVLTTSTPRFTRLGIGQAADATRPLAVLGPSGDFGVIVKNTFGAGLSNGVRIGAGTNASDFALIVNQSDDSTNLFVVRGDGLITIKGPVVNTSYLELAEQAAPATPTNAARFFVDTSNRFSWIGENGFVRTFDGTANTASRVYVLPNVNGTLVTTGDTGTVTNTMLAGSIDLATKVTGVLPGANGGTGVANTSKTITLGGNLTTSGAFNMTLTVTADTNVTLPTTGTLLTAAGAVTSATGTANQVNVSAATGAVTFSLPQSIATTSTPQFLAAGLGQAAVASLSLGVTGVANNYTALFTADPTSGQAFGVRIKAGTTSADNSLSVENQGATLVYLKVQGDGKIFMNSLTAEGSSKNAMCWDSSTKEVLQNASVSCTVSSMRFKRNWRDQDEALPLIAGLRPRTFQMKDADSWRVGFLAEEVEQVDPRLVAYDAQGLPHSVRYEDAVSVLTKGIQELAARVDALERR